MENPFEIIDQRLQRIEEILATMVKKEIPPNPKIKGIHGLAEALNVSVAKAQKLKNSGKIRFYQDGKLVLFDYNEIISDLKGVNLHKRGRPSKG